MTELQPKPSPPAQGTGDQWVTAYAAWIIRWRWLVLLACVVAALGLASGARLLGFSTDYRVFFSEQNPQLRAFESLQQVYTKDDNIDPDGLLTGFARDSLIEIRLSWFFQFGSKTSGQLPSSESGT